jgi:hypothetical protein
MNRRTFLTGSIAGGAVSALPGKLTHGAPPARLPNFDISRQVEISVPEKAFEKAFWIAARIVSNMRRIAFHHFGKDGWLAVSGGKKAWEHRYDTRDFRYGPKCAAYLYGDDPSFALAMGRRIFDEVDGHDGHIIWAWKKEQTAIHLAQVAKHFSDYIAYPEQDEFVKAHWDRLLKMVRWGLATYDRNGDGLLENGDEVPNHFWATLVGEPYNFPRVPNCADDVVVVATMQFCELLQITANYSAQHGLSASDWLKGRANLTHTAIERSAYDPDAAYYYLLYRAPESKWYHSLLGINESSRETDVAPYYAAMTGGNFSRALQVARYAQKVLLDCQVFPMPLQYPSYFWISRNYEDPYGFVNGGCWEEAYANCVQLWSHCRMLAPLYEAVKRRSEAYARDADCREWYTQNGEGRGHIQYGISATAHLCAVIEGLFGIRPAKFGFSEVEIHPNLPFAWSGSDVAIRVTLPNNGFLHYVYHRDEPGRTTTLTIETDQPRTAHIRVIVPGPVDSVRWDGQAVKCNMALEPGVGTVVLLERPIRKNHLQIKLTTCASSGLPAPVCSPV